MKNLMIAMLIAVFGTSASAQTFTPGPVDQRPPGVGETYCTRGDVIIGAATGAVIIGTLGYGSQLKMYGGWAKLTLPNAEWIGLPAHEARNPRIMASIRQVYPDVQDWDGVSRIEMDRITTGQHRVAIAVGGVTAVWGAAAGAFAGCVSRPLGQWALETTMDAAVVVQETTVAAWEWTTSPIRNWWNTPTEIVKREE